MTSEYAKKVERCCKEILNKYVNHAQSRITIPEDYLTTIAKKHEVSPVKIIRIMNDGRSQPVNSRKI